MMALVLESIKQNILSQLEDKNFFCCHVCNINLCGPESANAHIIGSKHQKKMKLKAFDLSVSSDRPYRNILSECQVNGSSRSSIAANVSSAAKEGILKKDGAQFICTVCNKSLSGDAPAEQHLSGKSHEKAIKLKNKFSGIKDIGGSILGTSFDSQKVDEPFRTLPNVIPKFEFPKVDMLLQCQKPTSNTSSSTSPLYNVANEGSPSKKMAFSDGIREEGDSFICDICNVSLNGLDPVKAHINGRSHRKKTDLSRGLLSLGEPSSPSGALRVSRSSSSRESSPMSTTSSCSQIESACDIPIIRVNEQIIDHPALNF